MRGRRLNQGAMKPRQMEWIMKMLRLEYRNSRRGFFWLTSRGDPYHYGTMNRMEGHFAMIRFLGMLVVIRIDEVIIDKMIPGKGLSKLRCFQFVHLHMLQQVFNMHKLAIVRPWKEAANEKVNGQ